MVKKFESHNVTVLYPNRCYNEVFYKVIGLQFKDVVFLFQRSKSKGLIDLNYSELYPVDDSFFGR